MLVPVMRLSEYLTREQIPAEAMAEAVGCSVHTIRNIRAGCKLPSAVIAYRIQRITGGEVRLEDWFKKISKAERGRDTRGPSLRAIYKIYRATGGLVGLEAFVGKSNAGRRREGGHGAR